MGGSGRDPPDNVVAANYVHEPGGLFPHPLPSPEGRGGVGSLMRFMERCHSPLSTSMMGINAQLGNIYWNEPDGRQWELLTVSYARPTH